MKTSLLKLILLACSAAFSWAADAPPLLKITDIPGGSGTRRAVIVGSVVKLNALTLPALFAEDAKIGELLIEAEFLTIDGGLRVPGGKIEVFCRRLTFPNANSSLSVEPPPVAAAPATTDNPLKGLPAGVITIFCDEFKEIGHKLHFNLQGGKGQDARPGADGTTAGANARAGGPPGAGGNGGTLRCSDAVSKEIETFPEILNYSGGPPGTKDKDRVGGLSDPGKQVRNRIGLPFGGWTYGPGTRTEGAVGAGSGAKAPDARETSQVGGVQPFDRNPPSDRMLSEVSEFVEGVAKQDSRLAKSLSHSYYNRTRDWLKGQDGKYSEKNLQPARLEFRKRLEVLMK